MCQALFNESQGETGGVGRDQYHQGAGVHLQGRGARPAPARLRHSTFLLGLPGQSPLLARAWVPRRLESSAGWAAALQAPQSFHRPSPGPALEEVGGFAPGRELQKVIRDGGWVLAEGCAGGRTGGRCACGRVRPTGWGLEVSGARWGWCVAGPQGSVCVLAGRPAHEALQGWGHGWAQAFGAEAGVEETELGPAGHPMTPQGRHARNAGSLSAEDTRWSGTQQ